MAEKVTRTAKRLRPFLLGAGQAAVINSADNMNRIALLRGGSELTATYPKTDAGMAAAIAAAVSGDVIMVPPCTLSNSYTIPSGVVVRGWATKWAYFTGQITLSQTSYIRDISIVRTASSSDALVGVVGPAIGTGVIGNVYIGVTNTGSGDAYCIQGGAGRVEVQMSTVFGNAAAGAGYGIYAGTGGVSMDSGWLYGSTLPASGISGDQYTAGDEISSGAISTTDAAGAEIAGLSIGEWYAVEAYNGPWKRGFSYTPEYTYRVSNDDGTTWEPPSTDGGYLGRKFDGVMYLDLPSWGAYAIEVDSNYARLFFQATTTSIRIRVGEDKSSRWYDNIGTLSWRLRSATVGAGAGLFLANAVRMDEGPVGTPVYSDRSAWDAANYAARHANDIDDTDGTGIHHTIGTSDGQVAAGNHTHALAEHTHASSDQGGTFDAANLGSGSATDGWVLTADGSGGADWEAVGGAGHTIQDEGTPLAARAALNFTGAGVTVTDDAGNGASVVTIPGGPDWVVNEDLSASCNGSTTDFATAETFVAGSTQVTLNGLALYPGATNDYTEDGTSGISLKTAPIAGDILLISYIKSGTGAATTSLADLYVATTGNDTTGSGSSDNPYLTLAKALSVLPDTIYSSVTVHVADGTYAEPVTLRRFRCQTPVLLKISGNVSASTDVVFTGTVADDAGEDCACLVSGNVEAEIEGLTLSATADYGVHAYDHAFLTIDRCTVTGTLVEGIYGSDRARLSLNGNITVSGWTGTGIHGYMYASMTYDTTDTLTLTGPGSAGYGIDMHYHCDFQARAGVTINITGVQYGIHAALCSVWQHWGVGAGAISITNAATPAGSEGLTSNDASTVSTDLPITLDHLAIGYHAYCVSYIESSGAETITNVTSASSSSLGGVVYRG